MRFKGIKLALALVMVLALMPMPKTFAQTVISGAISGTVTDPTGAAIAGANVTVTETTTGATHVVQSSAAGRFQVPLLPPGPYSVTVVAPGFQKTQSETVVALGQTAAVNIQLAVAKGSETVKVQANAIPLLQTQSSSLSTTISEDVVQNVPNPGSDITYPINLTQGVVMNTQGGYGNSSAFGLPATSNNFTINGAQDNDPFLNLNNSGPSNMLLGQNDVSQINIVANAYGAQYGGLGGVQENIITRSGGNRFHGNLDYFWTNSDMNANNYFNNLYGAPQAYANANQFAAALGGPVVKNKLFFFVNYEGLRFVTASTNTVYVPSQAYENDVIQSLTQGDPVAGTPAQPGEIPFYNKMFALYNNAPGHSLAQPVPGTTYTSPFTNTTQSYMDSFQSTPKNNLVENLITARVDYTIGPNDSMFVHFKRDHGVQPTYVDPISPVFNSTSDQPDYEGQLEETHTFSPNLVNQFLMSGAWYSAIFKATNQSAALSAFPYNLFFAGSFSALGGIDYALPQGRNVTQYQFNDDVSWTLGKNSVKFGGIFKRDDVTDFDLSFFTTPEGFEYGPSQGALSAGDLFSQGVMFYGQQQFPTRPSAPIALYQLGLYLQDQYRPSESFQITGGIRVTHNSNPVCQVNCFARLNGPYQSVNGATNQPYNKMISSGLHQAFPHLQIFSVEPRIGFTWSPPGETHTVVRGGFGMFTDVFPATVADSLLSNAPLNVGFITLNGLTDPSQPDSFTNALAQSNQAFVSAYSSGGSYDTISNANPLFSPPSIFTADPKIQYPTYEEWSLQVQHQVGRHMSFQVGYVGNHGYHEPVVNNGVNTAESVIGGTFSGLPQNQALPSFGQVSNVQSVASSNYNGLITSVKYQSPIITAQVNYTWSHALDEISNGGFLALGNNSINPIDPFNLSYNYGNADYNIKNNMNAFYVIHVPHFGGPKVLTANWLISGTLFWHSGFPFSVTSSNATGVLNNAGTYGGTALADIYNSSGLNYSCGKAAITTSCLGSWQGATDANNNPIINPNFQDPTSFGGQLRNQFYGPGYFDTDFAVMKGFVIPHTGGAKFSFGAQAYNVLNHPNFANPDGNFDSPTFGTVTSTVSTPTSAYGSFLGGDASPRIIQIKGKFTF